MSARMLKRVGLALGVAGVGAGAVVVSRPAAYRIERWVVVTAPAEIPFALVNDPRRWKLWSPWEAHEPGVKRRADGTYSGPGAVYTWTGPTGTGRGRMEILEAVPHESIQVRLERLGSRAAPSTLRFAFTATDGGLQLTWTEEGRRSLRERVHSLFTDLDAPRTEELERGLDGLRAATVAEVDNRRERDAVIREAEERARRQAPSPAPESGP